MSETEKNNELTVITPQISNLFFGRFDRSIMDNLLAIPKSYGKHDSGIVQDFLVFTYQQLKRDLFGFSKFTLNDFAKASGRNKADLCAIHPNFESKNPRAEEPPSFHGHTFRTAFDYALFNMLQKQIIFDRVYNDKFEDKIIELKSFPILQDIRVTVDPRNNNVKQYEIRVSDQLLDGFIRRYYLYDVNGYKAIKGKKVDGRKRFYLMLYRTRHLLLTQGQTKTKMALDDIAQIIGYDVVENRNRKTSVKRTLEAFKKIVPFDYSFVQGNPKNRFSESYHIEFDFSQVTATESRSLHTFFSSLMRDLKEVFKSKHEKVKIENESNPFQRWLNNKDADVNVKIDVICKSYYKAFNIDLSPYDAKMFIENGISEYNFDKFK